ncbi:MAG: tRNA (N(6)-L-threonylcarbamoyladenosine(37)-C(2))-methylthiotransferase MtaB [Muribaculaceae bacterium]|nr:tRNA (N(6)-L-threonylcarbamoyladenosine(37)-C(2))-methylthiotransferase MtaB [Muribaculaceae bacterium]MBQ3604766.1 tRNA (N(6)-L-threonylcarbamoyladenosine(37)-C(2))-methylthiotransferase MtaB [Muribaculaceae bacterium]
MIDNTTFGTRTAVFHTLGCKLNFAETSTVARMFADKGIRRAQTGEAPDVVVVNTCSVTELADKKCRQAIRSFVKKYPNATVIVTGCYAQLKSDEVAAIPGVKIVAGSDQKLLLTQFLDEFVATHEPRTVVTPLKEMRHFFPSCSRGDRTRYFLKVQDGCDYYCSYCTIPMARGRSRSGTIADLVAQARQVAQEGGKEIVITGVNIGDFGKGREDTFFDLIKALDEVEGIERYRISSIEPNLLTDEIIEWVAQSKRFMPHFHVPLQSGSDEVLKLMRRHYDTALFRAKIEKIRATIPDAFIGVDLIVGARGETPELFEQSRSFIESLDISRLHVFTYSERPGTRALNIDYVVDPREKHRRTRIMLALSEQKLMQFSERFVGTTRPVLLEHSKPGKPMSGFTDNYLKVEVAANSSLDNTMVNVRLDEVINNGEEIKGEVVR